MNPIQNYVYIPMEHWSLPDKLSFLFYVLYRTLLSFFLNLANFRLVLFIKDLFIKQCVKLRGIGARGDIKLQNFNNVFFFEER